MGGKKEKKKKKKAIVIGGIGHWVPWEYHKKNKIKRVVDLIISCLLFYNRETCESNKGNGGHI
jgi:hypothetical protein